MQKKKKHILVMAQYFYPEQFRINDICIEWIKRGYQVTVITGIPNYPMGKFYKGYGYFKKRKGRYHGVDIVRIPLIPRGKSRYMLVLNYLSFVVSGFFWSAFTRIQADSVYIYALSPMTQALPGVWYAKRKNIPAGIYITDLWPDNVEIMTGINKGLLIKSLHLMANYIYKRCDRIFTSSKGFVNIIHNRGVPLEKLSYWPQYAEDFYRPAARSNANEIPQDGVFNIIFAGNIGYAQGLEILPRTAAFLKKVKAKVRFNIVGDGRYKEEFNKQIEACHVQEYFNLIDKKPAALIPEYMAASDAALICLSKSKVFSMTIPAKTQSYMACGVPILASADGEVVTVIKDAECGLCSDAEDYRALGDNIMRMLELSMDDLKLMGENAVRYSKEHFNKKKLLEEMDDFFER